MIYVDLRVELLKNTLPSVRLLGEVLNRTERAAAFSAFYQQHMDAISQRLARYHGQKPTVMLHLHLGHRDTCCTTAVGGNLGELLRFAGGDNIAADSIQRVYGELNPEKVLAANPDVYIATGMAGPEEKRFSALMLGPDVSEQQAQNSFTTLLQQEPILVTPQRRAAGARLEYVAQLLPKPVSRSDGGDVCKSALPRSVCRFATARHLKTTLPTILTY